MNRKRLKLQQIRSKNSFRKFGLPVDKDLEITTMGSTQYFSWKKDRIIINYSSWMV